jgi:hypothetical protein
MFGSTAVMKAAKKGYKRYGVPGALAAGVGTLLGIRFIKRRFRSGGGNDDADANATTTDTESQ